MICGCIDRQVRAIDQRKGEMGEGGVGGEREEEEGSDVVLSLARGAARRLLAPPPPPKKKWLRAPWGALWMSAKAGHPRLGRPRRLPGGAASINPS